MSAPAKPRQAAKGWGSFLQGAVAGLESRLDTILAEDDQATARSKASAAAAAAAADAAHSRSPSRAPANDRLQERLTKAVGSNISRSARPSADIPSRTGTPTTTAHGSPVPSTTQENSKDAEKDIVHQGGTVKSDTSTSDSRRISIDSERQNAPTEPQSRAGTPMSVPDSDPGLDSGALASESDDVVTLRLLYHELNKTHREEMTAHLERIDALQSKLKYLSGQASLQARAALKEAEQGSLQQQLAAKDEQIVLLMEEGQALAKKELNLSNTVKKLRARLGHHERSMSDMKKKIIISDSDLKEAVERSKQAEAAVKSAEQRAKLLEDAETNAISLRSERDDWAREAARMKRQVDAANARAEAAEQGARKDAATAELKRVAKLEDELAHVKVATKLSEDRARAEVREIREESSRQQEKATVLEKELRNEIVDLESKLELLRSRSEEASSSTTGDAQIKLLRQIETLQSQYTFASDNWQSIESTLTCRVDALEKERDELAKRESDMRRRGREVSARSRKLDEDLESAYEQVRSLSDELSVQKTESSGLQSRLALVEKELESTNADLEQQTRAQEAELAQRMEKERLRWRLEAAQSPGLGPGDGHNHLPTPQTPPLLPGTMFSRKHSAELLLSLDAQQARRMGSSRRTSSALPATPLQRQGSSTTTTTTTTNANGNYHGGLLSPALSSPRHQQPVAPPSVHAVDDQADAYDCSSSPRRTVADVMSVSTVGAGPSVQLVERMSAAVRRLESEKAVSKEEVARLASQRDEARDEVVALMREIDEKRDQAKAIQKLQDELHDLRARYETTLEALGEKTEHVEDLQGDIEELKRIYKDLVERTMK